MPSVSHDRATCPRCQQPAGTSEERFNSHYHFACSACGFAEEGEYLGTEQARKEQMRAEGWTIEPSLGGTTFWATRILNPGRSEPNPA